MLVGAAFALSQGSASILSFVLGAAGLVAVHERLRRSFEPVLALIATFVIFAGTPLYWAMTHGAAAIECVAFAVVATALLFVERAALPRIVTIGAWSAVAAVPIVTTMLTRDAGAPTPAQGIVAMLFSSTDGLLALTPIAYLALIGVLLSIGTRRDRALIVLVFATWVVAIARLPSPATPGPVAHGLMPALALLAPGLCFLLDRARARPWLAVAPLVLFAIVWNYWLMVQYTTGTLPKDEPVSFGEVIRQQMNVHTRSPYVYPFAFPANVWFAWREGVPADRFEQLAFEPRRRDVAVVLDRGAERFLLDGWEPVGPDGSGAPRWTRDRRATIVLPLDVAPDRDLQLVLNVRARLEEPPVRANVGLEVNGTEIGRFVATPSAPIDVPIKVPASDVGRIWRAGYNRLTFVSHGWERVDSLDPRPPGPLASRLKDRPWPVAIYRVRIAPAS